MSKKSGQNAVKNKDEVFMKKVLKLAEKGVGRANPNPMVGCLIVKQGRIIGKGYHRAAGLAHAEIEALRSLKESPKGATLYVNLEPCNHFGKTPPCAKAIIKAGITRVVLSIADPNPMVKGKGIRALRKAGIKVVIGVLRSEARLLNEAYFGFHQKARPFVTIKFAASLDGKIATKSGRSKWITNGSARSYARRLRAQYQGVLVGINTILKDNPHLGVRDKTKKEPLRIIIDPELKIPLSSRVLRDNNVLIVTSKHSKKLEAIKKRGIPYLFYEKISLKRFLRDLARRGIISVLIEGGGETIGHFVDEKLFDKIYCFYSPIIIGGKTAISAVEGKGIKNLTRAVHIKNHSLLHFGDNLLLIGYPAL